MDSYIEMMPNDVITIILHNLDIPTTTTFAFTCKQMKSVIELGVPTTTALAFTRKKRKLNNEKIILVETAKDIEEIILIEIAKYNYINILKWISEYMFYYVLDDGQGKLIFSTAVEYGNLEILEWLHINYEYYTKYDTYKYYAGPHSVDNICYMTVVNGHHETLKWLKKNQWTFRNSAYSAAVQGNQLNIMKWLQEECKVPNLCLVQDNATICENLEILKWIIEENQCPIFNYTYLTVIKSGNLEILKWLATIGHERNQSIEKLNSKMSLCGTAAHYGHLNILLWLVDHGCNIPTSICYNAANQGHIHILERICGFGSEPALANCDQYQLMICAAVENNQLDTVKWLAERGHTGNHESCILAARYGLLQMLQLLRQNNCGWNEDVCMAAACRGHLEVLQWAIENGCSYNKIQCHTTAEKYGHEHIVGYLKTLPF